METTLNSPTDALTLPRQPIEIRPDRTRQIAERAYELYLARGAEEGGDVADWLEAERQIDREQGS